LVNRLPIKRGFRNPRRVEYAVVNVSKLNRFDAGTVVDVPLLVSTGLVRDDTLPVKVLGSGDIDRALTLRVDACSETAKAKIEAAGGTIEKA
jgi:large subunit ribosomal protein L15